MEKLKKNPLKKIKLNMILFFYPWSNINIKNI